MATLEEIILRKRMNLALSDMVIGLAGRSLILGILLFFGTEIGDWLANEIFFL